MSTKGTGSRRVNLKSHGSIAKRLKGQSTLDSMSMHLKARDGIEYSHLNLTITCRSALLKRTLANQLTEWKW